MVRVARAPGSRRAGSLLAAAGLLTISFQALAAEPSQDDLAAKPEVNFAALGVSYWRLVDDWGDKDAVVTIDGKDVAYSAGCESADFPYKQHWESAGELEILAQNGGRTCTGEYSKYFLRFYYELRQSESAKLSGDSLLLSWANDPVLQLKRFDPIGLEIRRWVIAEYLGDGEVLRALDLYNPDELAKLPSATITLDQGAVSGSPGCGNLEGHYELTGQSVLIHAGLELYGYCPEKLLHQDDKVIAALGRVRRWSFEGGQVIMRGDKGEIEAVLAPA